MTTYQLPNPDHFESNINGKNSHLFTLKNRAGMQIALTDYGARLVSVLVPDNKGNLVDVVLGFDSIEAYVNAQEQYHGATIGRVCNRIDNGKFTLNEKEYSLTKNNGKNALHGGPTGFHTRVWDRQISATNRIDFYYVSTDGEEGFPAEVKVNVSYELTNVNEIIIKYRAVADNDTILNLTNHAYFNLNGEGNADILDHILQVNAKEYLPINENQIPIGELKNVIGTVFDFSNATKIADKIDNTDPQLQFANGYDHSYRNTNTISNAAASVRSDQSGIELQVFTDLPTIHLYTGNFLSDDTGKSGHQYIKNGGFCLEAQHFIDSPNQANFPSIVLKASEEYLAIIVYKFSLKK